MDGLKFKTKNNSLRIAFFSNNNFIVVETPKGLNMFKNLVLEQDSSNMYSVSKTEFINNKTDGSLKYAVYIGTIKL